MLGAQLLVLITLSTTINVKTKISNCTLIKFRKYDLRFVVKTKDSLSLIIYKKKY